ncbi:aldehyde dehydrogenase family protein [Adhaeribacter aquaticus]|uniref:aldehyde dehydrogenase family protein n=1 Tax=Adhaeribacter aquaticus TaxID=299567 RepID=UPI0004297B25|nr:aldehyde dehydrogenase family protein [Adhaeribacter aquaticus]
MTALQELNKQFIEGQWLDGGEAFTPDNLNPYDDAILNTVARTSKEYENRAFAVAKGTANSWRNTKTLERQEILLKAANLLKERKAEVVDWLVKEVDRTVIKANMEVQQTHDLIVEGSSFPTRMHGIIPNASVPGQKNIFISLIHN